MPVAEQSVTTMAPAAPTSVDATATSGWTGAHGSITDGERGEHQHQHPRRPRRGDELQHRSRPPRRPARRRRRQRVRHDRRRRHRRAASRKRGRRRRHHQSRRRRHQHRRRATAPAAVGDAYATPFLRQLAGRTWVERVATPERPGRLESVDELSPILSRHAENNVSEDPHAGLDEDQLAAAVAGLAAPSPDPARGELVRKILSMTFQRAAAALRAGPRWTCRRLR